MCTYLFKIFKNAKNDTLIFKNVFKNLTALTIEPIISPNQKQSSKLIIATNTIILDNSDDDNTNNNNNKNSNNRIKSKSIIYNVCRWSNH